MARKSTNKRLKEKFTAKKQMPKTSQKKHIPTPKVDEKKEEKSVYDTYYKAFFIIPLTLLILGIIVIATTYATTGDFFNKGISLSGGTAVTITSDMAPINDIDTRALASDLQAAFSQSDIIVRSQGRSGDLTAVEVETDITDEAELEAFKQELTDAVPELTLEEINESSSTSGSALGDAFVGQIFQALLIAFVLMGIVVFIQFKVPIPSLAVMLAAFSDIVVTLAIVNILGIKLSTAGIAAFLMLIGYSVDTDIMLSTRVLKEKEGSVNSRIKNAFKTGMTMNITTLAAVSVALIVSQSAMITQIMTIIFIGLLVDMIFTWLQNASILKWYLKRKEGSQ